MKYFLFFITIMLIGATMFIQSSNRSGKFFPYEYKTTVLENGLKVILIKTPSNGLVAYYTIVRTGSRDEYEPGHSGFAHFFEHMMFRGTKKYPGNVYDKIVTEMGANANAYTTDDYTCYHLNITKENLERVMDLESDRFQNLFYEKPEFQTEAGAVYGEYRKGKASPYFWIWEKLCETAFEKHTYKHTTIGFEKDIQAMPQMYEYSLSFFKRYYRPENCVLLIVGDIEYEPTLNMVRKYYSPWSKGYLPPNVPIEPEQKVEKRASVKYPGKTLPLLALAYKGSSFEPMNKKVVATYLLGELAFGNNSELYKKLYLREQKVQLLEPEFNFNRDPFLWIVWAQIKNENDIKYVESEILNTIEFFQNNKVDATKLENLKKRMRYQFLMSLDTPGKVAGVLARILAMNPDLETLENFYRTMDAISPDDIVEAAKYFFNPQKRTVVTLTGNK